MIEKIRMWKRRRKLRREILHFRKAASHAWLLGYMRTCEEFHQKADHLQQRLQETYDH